MIRFLPLGTMLYLCGGLLSGFGIGHLASDAGSLTALGCSGVGALMIAGGYTVLRPLLRYAKQQGKGKNSAAPLDAQTEGEAEAITPVVAP